MARKVEFGEKIADDKRIIRIGNELFEVDPATADAYEELLELKTPTRFTRAQSIFLAVCGVVFLGPLTIWLYRLVLGL